MISQNNKKSVTSFYSFSEPYLKEYQNYSNYLDTLDLSEESKEWRLKHIRGFLDDLNQKEIGFLNLKPDHIYNYMEAISSLSSKTRENRAICIRLFLDYLYNNKKIKISGRKILDTIRCPKGANVISIYTNEEINSIIKEIDINTSLGKRDYALLLLFVNYGLRLKDVRYLTLENIHWLDEKIIVTQHKDNEVNEFPLTKEVRYALLDYLKNARPESTLKNIFLTREGKVISSGGIYNIVNKYFQKANIVTTHKHHGSHAFRHSLATSLLKEKNGIKEISSILGHNNLENTKIYAKVQFEELKKMSLEVPLWKI